MTTTIKELVSSRAWGFSSGQLDYVITGTNDDTTALATVAANSPLARNNLVRKDYSVEPVGDPTESLTWTGKATYSTVSNSGGTTEAPIQGFNTTGGTQRFTVSYETVDKTTTASDYGGAIGVSKNGENMTVEGVDVVSPVFSFTETWIKPADEVTTQYKGDLFRTTGKLNNGTFKGCATGECLFLGATGTQRNEDEWEITYNFAASPNNDEYKAAGGETVNKGGWDYVWTEFAEVQDDDTKLMVMRPIATYVERVYDLADFSVLDIGGS
jgi:hypothetical protein